MQAAAILLGEHVSQDTCNLPFELANSTFNEDQVANRHMERGIINSMFPCACGNFPFEKSGASAND